jgi:hypothetical protein
VCGCFAGSSAGVLAAVVGRAALILLVLCFNSGFTAAFWHFSTVWEDFSGG